MARVVKAKTVVATELITVGKIRLVRLDTGKLWLTHAGGEGMECGPLAEQKLARTLEQFFKKHF